MQRLEVSVAKDSIATGPCEVEWTQGRPIVMTLCSPIGRIEASGDDLFDALCQIRLLLEEQGYRLLCNAARLNAYPSRMTRQMGEGRKIYLLRHGKQARREDLVDMFEFAPFGDVATVADQRKAYDEWIGSLQ